MGRRAAVCDQSVSAAPRVPVRAPVQVTSVDTGRMKSAMMIDREPTAVRQDRTYTCNYKTMKSPHADIYERVRRSGLRDRVTGPRATRDYEIAQLSGFVSSNFPTLTAQVKG